MSRAVPRFKRVNAPLATILTNAFRMTAFYLVDNQVCLFNADYIMQTAVLTSSTEGTLAANWISACLSALRNSLAADCFIQQVKCTCLTQPTRMPAISVVASGSQAGLVSGNHMPSEVAAIISKQTGVKGQHGRGRLYLPGIPTVFVTPSSDANRLTAAAQSTIGNVGPALFSPSIVEGTNQAQLAVTTRVPKGQPVVAGALVNTLTVRALLGVIRRRRIGRGK